MWKLGLAVSGGADSTALLVLLASLREKLGFTTHVLHVDHGLRPDSAEDAAFVRQLAKRYDMPITIIRPKIIRQRGESLEMAARRVRLDFFRHATAQLGLDAIATGHHADDVAETFLLRLARGSGPEGLAGLKRISHLPGITFIRPLLDIRDVQLRDYLRQCGISWREDSTNGDIAIPRNLVRHTIIPFLRENLDAHITEHICKTAAILRGDLTRDPSTLNSQPSTSSLIPNSSSLIPNSYFLIPKSYALTITPAQGFQPTTPQFGVFPAIAYFNRAALAGRHLMLRVRQAGDRIVPTGLDGHSRKLQDVFVTAKVPTALRDTLPLLVDADTNEILWVPGYRVAASVAVPSATAPSWRMVLECRK